MFRREERPRRPTIPTSLYALAATVVVERAMLAEGEPWLDGAAGRLAAIGCVALLVASAPLARHRALCALLATVTLCAMVLSSLCLARQSACTEALRTSSIARWQFRVQSDPKEGTQGFRCRASAMREGGSWGDVWLVAAEELEAGTTIECVGRFAAPGDDDWSRSSRMQGVCGTVRVARVMRTLDPEGLSGLVLHVRRAVLRRLRPESSDERALIAGCVCGWRTDLAKRGVDELFSRCGAAHLVAVSGSHLAIVAGLVTSVLLRVRVRPGPRLCIIGLASGAFAVLCGAPPSALRACAMMVAAMVGNVAGRRSHALSGVCVVGLVMALVDPSVSGQLGFVLSVVSVGGLCIFAPYVAYLAQSVVPRLRSPRWLPQTVRRHVARTSSGLVQSASASLTAQLVTLPVVANAFGEVSLVGPLANMVVATPFALMVSVGMLAGVLCWVPWLGEAAILASELLAKVVLWALRLVDGLPIPMLQVGAGSLVPLACVVLLVAILVAWPRVSRRTLRLAALTALTATAVMLFRWRCLAPARMVVLDIGQGDAILVQDGASAVLVDAGPDDAVVEALSRRHVLHLDAVVVTHLHADHYAGIASLVGRVPCDEVIVARGVARHVRGELAQAVGSLCEGRLRETGYGDVLHVGGFALEVVSPAAEVDGSENAHSLEMLVRYERDGRTLTALLTGDAERDETGSALARGDLCDIDVLKVGHHGSEVSITEQQARALDPEVSVASAGEGNSYGHPNQACVEALEAAGSMFLCTKDVGDVELRPGTSGPEVNAGRTLLESAWL